MIKEKFQKFLGLQKDKKILLFKVFFLLCGIRIGMWLSFQHLLKFLNTPYLKSFFSGIHHFPPETIVWAVRTTSHYIPKATCLAQALATQVLLVQGGKDSDINIGVAKGENSPLEAHAWVNLNGKVLIGGGQLDQYTWIMSLKGKGK